MKKTKKRVRRVSVKIVRSVKKGKRRIRPGRTMGGRKEGVYRFGIKDRLEDKIVAKTRPSKSYGEAYERAKRLRVKRFGRGERYEPVEIDGKRRKAKKARIVLIGNPCAQTSQNNLLGGGTMPKAKKVMPWFKKPGSRKRRRASLLGGKSGGRGIAPLVMNGAVTIGGAAAGSLLAARVPLPAQLAGFRGLLPVVAGIALGASKFGRKPTMQYLALGMVVAGGLAIGRQYAPQLFAGEDEMLGLPMADEMLGLTYEGEEDENDLNGLGAVASFEGEGDDLDLMGEYVTGADV